MVTVNAVGLTCPLPVIETKKAIAKLPQGGGVVQILVDNIIACENLSKMAGQKGYECAVEKQADKLYAVTITVGEGSVPSPSAPSDQTEPANLPGQSSTSGLSTQTATTGKGLVVAIGQDKMGSGSDDLGKILIKGFIFSLANLEIPPKAVIFFNSGVRLVLENANTLEDLKALKQKGTAVLVCGTCVDFYNCKNQVAVGEITNMYNIVEVLSSSANIINI